MRMLARGIGLLSLALLLAGPFSHLHAAGTELKKLHVLMVFDTEDEDLAPSLVIDEWRMQLFLRATIPEERCSITVLKGKDVTPDRILAYYRDLKLEAGEGLLFFYGGHGATDKEKGHYFKLACGKNLVRSELRKAMEARKTGAVLILTDCCSTPRQLKKESKIAPKGVEEIPSPKEIHATVRDLLFQPVGTVDVTAASDNASWGDREKGGLFTRSLCRMLTTPRKALGKDRDGRVTWKRFFPTLQKETEIVFRSWSREWKARGEKIEGDTQKPHSFALGLRTCAVVGIENGGKQDLVYQWRWQGEETWNEVKLAEGKQKVHFLPLTGNEKTLPLLEVAIKGRGKGKLKTIEWTGEGLPSFDDGKTYSLQLRKKS